LYHNPTCKYLPNNMSHSEATPPPKIRKYNPV
jgi:hypothetical protein